MPHTTDTPAPKRHPIITILCGALMLVFFVQIIFPGALQWPVTKTDQNESVPLHFDGEVVNIVARGYYGHPGQSQAIIGDQIVVRDKHGAEFVVHPHELNTSIPIGTTKLVKTVHDGRLGFSPFHIDMAYDSSQVPTSDDYYVVVDDDGNVIRSDGKTVPDAAKEMHLEAYANFLIERVVEKFGANSTESKKLDGMRQHYETDQEIIKEASKMLPTPIKPLTPEPALPSDEDVLRAAEEALKNASGATPKPPKTTRG